MCQYCPNNRYNFTYSEDVKKVVNIVTYISLRSISHSIAREQLYIVCRELWRNGYENGFIEGKIFAHPVLSGLNVLCCVTGSIKCNYIVKPIIVEMFLIISK